MLGTTFMVTFLSIPSAEITVIFSWRSHPQQIATHGLMTTAMTHPATSSPAGLPAVKSKIPGTAGAGSLLSTESAAGSMAGPGLRLTTTSITFMIFPKCVILARIHATGKCEQENENQS